MDAGKVAVSDTTRKASSAERLFGVDASRQFDDMHASLDQLNPVFQP